MKLFVQLHLKQKEIVASDARFKIVRAGRRSGKTILKIETLLFNAVSGKNRVVFYIAPTQIQARDIIWEAFKKRVNKIGKLNEQRLEISVLTIDGGRSLIKIAGWENRENFRGKFAHHIEFDEVDTMKDFFVAWKEIFRPALIDTEGTASFGGTPKKENPNLRRLEKEAETNSEFKAFHFSTYDNPFLSQTELDKLVGEYKDDKSSFKQEIMAEYVDNQGALFKYTALVDIFSNTITKRENDKYLIVDIADDGTDKTIFNFWQGLESYRIEQFERLNTEGIINQLREYASQERIPYSHIAVDAIGVGAGVASSSLLDGIVGFKSSLSAIKTDIDPVKLPNVHYLTNAPLISEYKNLRSQCIFVLANKVNNHELACSIKDTRIKEKIIEELGTYQEVSVGDGKRMATSTEDVKALIGISPDIASTFIMRMYFEIRNKMLPDQSEQAIRLKKELDFQFNKTEMMQNMNSTK